MKTLLLITAIWTVAGCQLLADCGKCGSDAKHKEDKGCADGSCAAAPAKVEEVKKVEAKETAIPTMKVDAVATLLKAGTPVIVLDARSGKWDDGRRVPGAKSLNAESSEKDIAAVIADKNALVITYCANTKCQASPKLARHLIGLGYKNVMEMPEGIEGWEAAGQKIEKVK